MIFVFRKIIYDSALIHQYESESDFVKDLPINAYSPNEFSVRMTDDFAAYNYVYLPHSGRYYYMDILEYKNKTIQVKFTCDYGRTFGDVIASDFYMVEESMDGTQFAKIPNGEHIMSDTSILYAPDKNSLHKLNKSDADKVISLLTSGIIVNFNDFTPESYIPPAPPIIDGDNGQSDTLQPVDMVVMLNQIQE